MPQEKLNLRHLRAFCEIARCGSISAASEKIFLSQPAITQALTKLEKSLNINLFVRKSNGMFLTEPGELFQHRAERALRYIQAGADRVSKSAGNGKRSGFTEFHNLLTDTQLRAFLAVAETGNFLWAARNTGVSRPSIHRAIKDLERLSGVPLFYKTVQGFDLTPAGQTLEQHARLTYAELRQSIAEINAWLGHDTAQITIGTLPLARSYILPEAINNFTEMRPDVSVKIVDGPYKDLLHGLRHGQLDILIGALRDPLPIDDICQEELFHDELAIVAGKDHPLTKRVNITIEDLAAYPWAAPAPGIPTRVQFDALFENAGIEAPTRIVETSSLILIRGLLQRSDRLTVISSHQIYQEIQQGSLEIINFQPGNYSRPIGLTVRQDWHPTETQSLLLDLLREAGKKRPY